MNNNSMLIPVSLDTTKIIVAHYKLDLFLRGYYQIQENLNSDKFNRVKFVNSIFINKENNWFDAYDLGFQFNCNYGGTGPNNLVRFLREITDIDEKILENVIFNNRVVEYDVSKNDIIPRKSYFTQDGGLDVSATKDGKLIFFLEENIRNRKTNESLANDVIFIINAMNQMSNGINYIQDFIYVGDRKSQEFHYYTSEGHSTLNNSIYNLIIRFQNFEIWIDHFFGNDHSNIQFNDNFKEFISYLDLHLTDDKYDNSIFKLMDKLNAKRLDNQSNQYITVHYN